MFSVCLIAFLPVLASGGSIEFTPCRLNDQACVDQSANVVYEKIISGIPSLGIEPSEPLFVDGMDGNLSILNFKFRNSSVIGFQSCKLSNVKLNLESSSLKFNLNCPKLEMHGKYEIGGRLIIIPVEGNGNYSMYSGQYNIGISAEVKTVKGKDGKTYWNIKNFKLNARTDDFLEFDFDNLFNGQKDLSDAVHKFAHENWREVAELVQEPVLMADIKIIFSRVNKYLKSVAGEEIILN